MRAVSAATTSPIAAGAPLVIVPGVPTTDALTTPGAAPADASGPNSALLFKGLFSDRSEPISQVVRDLWTPQAQPSPGSPAAPSRAASLVSASGARELFRPQATDASGRFGR